MTPNLPSIEEKIPWYFRNPKDGTEMVPVPGGRFWTGEPEQPLWKIEKYGESKTGEEVNMTPQEMEKGFEEIWRLFAETDRKFQETDEKFKETDEKFKETDKRIDKAVGSLTSKWGRFVEGMVAPAVERLLGERGIEVDRVYQRVRARREGGAMEIDVLAVDGEYAALVEVKSTLSLDDVNEHLENLGRFRDFFPEYADRKIVGAVAGIVVDEGVDRYAYKKGLFVLRRSGDAVAIANDESFRPRLW